MKMDAPLATLRLASDHLDAKAINKILLSGSELVDVRTSSTVWMVTTEGYKSDLAQDHLEKMTKLISHHLAAIRQVVPEVIIDFSLLVFDPEFRTSDLPKTTVLAATELGSLAIELPAISKQILVNSECEQVFDA